MRVFLGPGGRNRLGLVHYYHQCPFSLLHKAFQAKKGIKLRQKFPLKMTEKLTTESGPFPRVPLLYCFFVFNIYLGKLLSSNLSLFSGYREQHSREWGPKCWLKAYTQFLLGLNPTKQLDATMSMQPASWAQYCTLIKNLCACCITHRGGGPVNASRPILPFQACTLYGAEFFLPFSLFVGS